VPDIFANLRGTVGKKFFNGDQDVNFRAGRGAEVITDNLNGRYYQAAKDGELFHATSATPDGTAMVLDVEGTTWTNAINNPASSGVDVVILEASYGRGVTGDIGPGTWFWVAPASGTSTVPTGTAMTTVSGRIGATAGNKAVPLETVTVEAADGTRMRVAFAQTENVVADVGGIIANVVDHVDGSIIVPPGFYVGLTFDGNAGVSPLAHISFMWKEVPV